MSVDTYLKLRADLADTINRDDLSADITAFEGTTIESAIKRAVATATISIQRDLVARGGYKSMEAVTASISTTGGVEYVDFPTDFAGARTFLLTSNPLVTLEFVDPTTLFTQYPNSASGQPEKYTIVGDRRAYLRPVPDGVYTTRLIYLQSLTALTNDSDTNWLLTTHPDIYRGAAMIELTGPLGDDDRAVFWKAYYDLKMGQLLGEDRNVRWAAVPSKPNLNVSIA